MSLLLGQTVVTDTGAGGYRLAAASPAVAAEDREHLALAPLVSDFLHLESPPRVYWSFYRLPSGNWAFSRRHAAGTRRGSNRIVAHTLVLPERALDALAWEPRLLPTCAFRPAGGGATATYEQVGSWDDGDGSERPDLEIEPPPDTSARRLELIAGRKRFLAGQPEGERLEESLAEVVSALEQGSGFLAPQGNEPEQLLALAWSLLPRADRRETGWTTHLAPGAGTLFRLANAPSPAEARAAEREPERWRLAGEGPSKAGGEAISRALVSGRPAWAEVASGWYEGEKEPALSLARGGARLERWILHVAEGGAPAGGFSTLAELEGFLARRKITAASAGDPWQSPGTLLDLTAATLLRQAGGEAAAAELAQAAGLVLPRLDRDTLAPALAEVATNDREGGRLELALDLALRAAGRAVRGFSRLFEAATGPVEERGDDALLGRLAERFLLPRLAAHAALAHEFEEGRIDRLLAALPAHRPEALAAALDVFPEPVLYDRAVRVFARLAAHDPTTARQVAAAVATTGRFPAAVRDRAALVGLAGALAACGTPAEHWLPYALEEAVVLDREGKGADRRSFLTLLERLRLSPEGAAAFAADLHRVLGRLHHPGAALRTLTHRLAPGLPLQAQQITAALARLDRLDDDAEYLAWGETVATVALELDRSGHTQEASTLRRNWWTDFARREWISTPAAALGMLDGLRGSDAGAVAGVWMGRLRQLEERNEAASLVVKLRTLAEGDPERRRDLEIENLKGRFQSGLLDLEGVVQAVQEIARSLPSSGTYLVDTLVRHFLPRNGTERLQALLPLAVSSRLPPATRGLLGGKLTAALREAERNGDLPAAVPVDQLPLLARRRDLLLAVARARGKSWNQNPADAVDFLEAALARDCHDAAGVFLAAAERRQGFLSKHLTARASPNLIRRLARAAADSNRGAALRPFLPQIDTLANKLREGG